LTHITDKRIAPITSRYAHIAGAVQPPSIGFCWKESKPVTSGNSKLQSSGDGFMELEIAGHTNSNKEKKKEKKTIHQA
jgi:hypothetical protein